MNSPKCKKLCFGFRCEDKPVKINVNSPLQKLVGYFAIIFSWHVSDPQFFIMCFEVKIENFSILFIESDSNAGRTASLVTAGKLVYPAYKVVFLWARFHV